MIDFDCFLDATKPFLLTYLMK